jgi:hypothetical protein
MCDYYDYLIKKDIKKTKNVQDDNFSVTWPVSFSFSSCGMRGTFSDLLWLYQGLFSDRYFIFGGKKENEYLGLSVTSATWYN